MRNIGAAVIWLMAATMVWAETAPTRQITVTGQAEIAAVPDMAIISMGVTQQATVAKDAVDALSVDMAGVLARLAELGVEQRDMQTSQLSLNPIWEEHRSNGAEPRRIVGFVASSRVSLRVRDLGALGGLLDAVLEDGANRFSGLRFGVQEPEPLEAEARKAAVRDAVARATQLAEAAGVTLGAVRDIRESGGPGAPMMMEMAGARSNGVPVAAGEVSIGSQVTVIFDIAP